MSLSDLQNINGDNGFIVLGKNQDDRLGTAVYSPGDINGDGIDDLVVTSTNAGIPNTDPFSYSMRDRRGKAYLIFGDRNAYEARFDLDRLNGSNGFILSGIDENHELGNAVSAGDLNGDGIDDLVVAASFAGDSVTDFGFTFSDNKGEVYVIFGQQNSFEANFDLQSLNGNNGFKLKGIDAEDLLGTAIASEGDLNGDGINDLAISASGAGVPVTNSFGFTSSDRSGEVFVLFGKGNGFNSQIDLASLDGSNGFIIEGKDKNDSLGSALSNAGDINGDGIDDLIIGSPNAGEVLDSPFGNGDSDQRGEVQVIFGSRNGFNDRFNVADRTNGVQGFSISGIGIEDNLGSAVSSAGDLNGDGIDDLILGATSASVNGEFTQEGQVYVVFGRQDSFGTQFDLNSLDGSNGFSIAGINSGDGLGNAVTAGDFNGDGIDDLLIAANTSGETINAFGFEYSDRRGAVYLIFGSQDGFANQIDLANLDDNVGLKFVGINSEDLLGSAISIGGDLNGDGIDDLVVSAPDVDLTEQYSQEGTTYVIFGETQSLMGTEYPDSLIGGNGNDTIFGKAAEDTIRGNNGNDLLNGGSQRDSLFGGQGKDTLNGDDNGDTLFGGNDNDLLNGNNNQDQLYGESGNDILNGGTDNDRLDGGVGNDILNGTDSNNLELQLNEQDTLIGGAGADKFILGDENQVYYRDRNPNTEGGADFALIEDFNPQQDQIQLAGDRSLYDLSFYNNGQGTLLANLWYLLPGEVPERIAILNNASPQLSVDDPGFVYLGNTPTEYADSLSGGNSNDIISGEAGDDTIRGNNGNDLLNGGSQRDSLFGGQGLDTLNGDDNGDTLFGGNDNDLLNGNNNQDQLYGESGNDILNGGTDNDRLDGGFGNDTLNGTDSNNLELQLNEQDTLIGGAGADKFILGDENQVYYRDRNPNTEGGADFALIEDFNPQQDQIQLAGDRSLYDLSFYNNDQGILLANLLYVLPGEVPERIAILNNASPQLSLDDSGFVYVKTTVPLVGTPYADNLSGNNRNDMIFGEAGDDTLFGNDGNDLINGGSQRDSLFGGQGFDTLNGDDNGDTLFGGENNDLLNGNNNQDQLYGESGSDILNGGTDNDRLDGGVGNDTLNGTEENNLELQLNEQDTLIGGAGADLFILGDENQVYYRDRNPNTEGGADFALIEDFNPQQDQIQLAGDRSLYDLSFYNNDQGILLANILLVLPGEVPERIGILDDVSSQLTLDDPGFTFI